MPKKFTNNMVLRHIDGRYYIFKVTKRLDDKLYHCHTEPGKIVMSRIHEEISPDTAKEYLLSMKENTEKKIGIEDAQKVYDFYLKDFGLSSEEKVEEIAEIAEIAEEEPDMTDVTDVTDVSEVAEE